MATPLLRTDRRRVAAGMFLVAFLVAGTAVLAVLQLRTAGTAREAGRCQGGDLAACRAAAVNIARSCSRDVVDALPSDRRPLAAAQCAIVAVAVRDLGSR